MGCITGIATISAWTDALVGYIKWTTLYWHLHKIWTPIPDWFVTTSWLYSDSRGRYREHPLSEKDDRLSFYSFFLAGTPPAARSPPTTAAAPTAPRSWGHPTPSMSPGRVWTAGGALREDAGTPASRWWAVASWPRWRPSRRGERTRWEGEGIKLLISSLMRNWRRESEVILLYCFTAAKF